MAWTHWGITGKSFFSLSSLSFQTVLSHLSLVNISGRSHIPFSSFQVLMNCSRVGVLKSLVQYTLTTVSHQTRNCFPSPSSGLTQAQKGGTSFYHCVVSCLSLATSDSRRAESREKSKIVFLLSWACSNPAIGIF